MDGLELEAVTAVLRDHLGSSAECTRLYRGRIGHGQETWFLDVVVEGRQRELVLRRTSAGGPMSYTDRRREFETLRRVAASGLPVPPVHWIEDEGSRLGRAYFVMDRLAGAPLGAADEAMREVIAYELGEYLARLHLMHPEAMSAADATVAELDLWRGRYLRERPAPVPLLSALLAWLEINRPPLLGSAVLNWGDPGPHNVLVADGHVSALLDWEMAHAGHPLDDLGVAVWSCLGILDPEILIKGYETVAGPVDRAVLDYFEVLAAVTRAIAMLAGVSSYLAGTIDDPEVAGLGLELVGASLERGVMAAGWVPPQAPELRPTSWAGILRPCPAEATRGVARLIARDVLAAVEDSRLRRQLKNATALLEATAQREELRSAFEAWQRQSRAQLLSQLAAAGLPADLEVAAEVVERKPGFAILRSAVRQQLLAELMAERLAFEPLRQLYGPSGRMASLRPGLRPEPL